MAAKTKQPKPPTYGPIQIAARIGLARWQAEVARERDLLPGPDLPSGRWSEELALKLTDQVPDIVKAVGAEHPIGASRAADHLSERAGLEITWHDVKAIAAARPDLLPVAMEYEKGYDVHALYAVTDLDALAEQHGGLLAGIVADRLRWTGTSQTREQAADALGVQPRELDKLPLERGPLGRYDTEQVRALAADETAAAEVIADRRLGPDQAASRLEIRRTDWDYAVAAGWIAPVETVWMKVSRRREVPVPLYRTGDVDALLEIPGVPWEQVRACRRGEPSPLREFAPHEPSRATVLRRWLAEFGARHDVEVWAVYDRGSERWRIDWEMPGGHPTREEVQAAIGADPVVSAYAADLELSTEVGAAIRWARDMLEPGAAVILDTETTGLGGDAVVVEIAVIDAHTGRVLLDTLVNPGDVPVGAGARAVHGITDAQLAQAPGWDRVLPKLRRVTRDRTVLAYNAEFDQRVVVNTSVRNGKRPMHLAEDATWGCVMTRRSDWLRTQRWQALGGGHRALGDCRSAREVLIDIAQLDKH
ncbi:MULTISPECIES: 3'-5' exonuclease [Actinosynnema]|uniref:3'-5' exonuclease n=1 Tax=Actinosynnema TaxID=40566 RepID=UPI0020A27D07|nr:3'-5' exonuclease [Actinosynnema pretiosum]MCP2098966.1 Exonuclease [Actinosynnema pretiosum]